MKRSFTSPEGAERLRSKLIVCLCVCVWVCVSLSVRQDFPGATRVIFTNFFVHVVYGRGSVLLRQNDEIASGRGKFGGFAPHWQRIVMRSLQITSCSRRDHSVVTWGWWECTARAKCDLRLLCHYIFFVLFSKRLENKWTYLEYSKYSNYFGLSPISTAHSVSESCGRIEETSRDVPR